MASPSYILRGFRWLLSIAAAVTCVVGLALGAATDSPKMAVARLELQPDRLLLDGPEDAHGILVTGRDRDGNPIDLTGQSRFLSSAETVVTVGSDGLCRAVAQGEAEIRVVYGRRTVRLPVIVRSARKLAEVSFRQEVEPILTRSGCNMGACHGKLAGQNGFKLSLRAYAPELDIVSLTTDITGRRINPAAPEESLLIQKALARVPHEGRQRFAEGSRYHRTLVDWIAARTPGPRTNEADVIRLELWPGARTFRVSEQQQILARAHYADGQVRDVTWLVQFFSNDPNTASVTPDGLIRAVRAGATSIRAHFQGLVEVMAVTIPYENRIVPREFVKANNPIDGAVFSRLASLRIPPSGECDDATFLRRAALDVTGTLPTAEQVAAFVDDQRSDKRSREIERLLASPEFTDYWTLQWSDLFQNRRERDHDVRGAKGVRAFQAWLRSEVATNRPWNELAREILTARGSVAEHPEIGYFVYNVGEKSRIEESDTPDAVAQAFLGTRIGCARCHNHPLERYTQDDFYHFAACFSKVRLQRAEPDRGTTVLSVSTREEEEQRKRVAEVEKAWVEATNAMASAEGAELEKAHKKAGEQEKRLIEARRELVKVSSRVPTVTQPRTHLPMAPQPLDRSELAFGAGEDPRARLVDWITSPRNASFSGAMVNRLWKHYFGVGLVEPVDDLRASNPPANPVLWTWLKEEFVRSGYDVRHLMRLILNSRTYQLSSATRPGNETDKRFYSHYYARRLPAEVMLDAIAQSTGVPDEFKGYPVGTKAVQLPEPGVSSYFLTLFGRSDRVTACACERNGEVTLPQLLHLQNGDVTVKKVQAQGGRLSQLLERESRDDRVIETLFLETLSRRPTESEVNEVRRAMRLSQGATSAASDASTADRERERVEAFRDLFWALLNSKEFAFNH